MKYIWLLISLVFILIGCGGSTLPFQIPDHGFRSIIHPVTFHVDKEFSYWQQGQIERAGKSWEVASSETIRFNFIWNSARPTELFKDDVLNDHVDNFIWYIPIIIDEFGKEDFVKNNVGAAAGLTYYSTNVDEYYEERVNIILGSNVIPPSHFYSVILHELGHSIGLQHTNTNISVMHWRDVSPCITETDAEQLCRIYRCVPKPECTQEEANILAKTH